MENALSIAGFIAFGLVIFLGAGFLVKLLWNWLLPNITSIKKITYIQALGILILARILFGGFGHHGGGWGGRNCHHKSAYCSKWNDCGYKDGNDKVEKK